ncbi:hypothetical protein A33Q_0159 [Indibacter alkaliphilus LW1]|uniref:TolB-like 6-blade propeller-like n=1 Tax=Indibacter alkaliphilus (strain CCUG 57479 / KCTC 22604 / LW1) TaxID=1189612 RepID=S2DMT9_INDAL|nr:hypothetical protein [Indibacter alkaliphilus]EPA00288.1 hypothetical protein A33Q_0159 [Indibacter alkaliphilus LW1]
MIQRCLWVVVFLSIISCNQPIDKDTLPNLVDLTVIDSVLVEEPDFFMNGQFQVKLIGDSIIGVSSYKSPSVGFYHISGTQRKRIASGDYPIGAFSPSYFDASEYPVVYILDGKSESVLSFDVEKQEFLEKIKLSLPDGKKIKLLGANFKKTKNSFLVELTSSAYDVLHPDFYKKSGSLVYTFGMDGKAKSLSFMEYPDVYKSVEVSLTPSNYLSMGSNSDQVLFSFPHSKTISIYSDSGEFLDSLTLPQSRYFDYSLVGAEKVVGYDDLFNSVDEEKIRLPNNDYFTSVYWSNDLFLFETWMNNGEIGPDYATFCHLLLYDQKKKKWSETSNPMNLLDIGMLVGVVNDTLYFFEGSLLQHDEKYIKRAVLK